MKQSRQCLCRYDNLLEIARRLAVEAGYPVDVNLFSIYPELEITTVVDSKIERQV
jgi:hypothetical protein